MNIEVGTMNTNASVVKSQWIKKVIALTIVLEQIFCNVAKFLYFA